MSEFRLQNNVPRVYVEESRDFQKLLRMYDCIFNGLKYDIDTIEFLTNTANIKNSMLPLLATKLGFFSTANINDAALRLILQAFPVIIKNKGSLLGIKQAINLYLKIQNIDATVLVSYRGESNDLSENHTLQIGSDVTFTNMVLLNTLLDLTIPSGIKRYFYHFELLGSEITNITQSDDVVLLGKIVARSQSVLRNNVSEYDVEDVDSDYEIHIPSTADDDSIITDVKNSLIGSVGVLEIAGKNDTIPEFSTTDTYTVGDVVLYDDDYYQCINAVNSAGAWDASDWERIY